MSNYCIRFYGSNNSVVLFSILLLVLVSRINYSILTRYSYSRNSNILYTEFYHNSQGKSISCYGPTQTDKHTSQLDHLYIVLHNTKQHCLYVNVLQPTVTFTWCTITLGVDKSKDRVIFFPNQLLVRGIFWPEKNLIFFIFVFFLHKIE